MNDTRARNIVRRLTDIGAISPGMPTKRLVDEVQAMTHDDYIPGGKTATSVTNLRAAPAGRRCGVRTGEDIQSGPFYCGAVATLMGDSDGGIVCACAGHESYLRQIAK